MPTFNRRTFRRQTRNRVLRHSASQVALERLEDRTLLSVDVIVSDLDPATTQIERSQYDSDISISQTGKVVVAWTHSSAESGLDVRFRRYDSEGTSLDDADRTVNWRTTGDEYGVKVATDFEGAFVVGYQSIDSGGDIDAFLDFYDSDGIFYRQIQVGAAEAEDQRDIDVAMMPWGSVVVTWTEPGSGSVEGDIFAQGFTDLGDPYTPEILIAGRPDLEETQPVVEKGILGDFVVAYAVGETSIAYQRVSTDDQLDGASEVISPPGFTTGDSLSHPQIGQAFDGSFVIAYHWQRHNEPDLTYWHLFNRDGTQRAEGAFAAAGSSIASVDMDQVGNFVIGYTQSGVNGDEAEATFFDSTGSQDETIAVHQNYFGGQSSTRVAIQNNLLAATYSSIGDDNVKFSVIEHRRAKLGAAHTNDSGGLTFKLDSNASRWSDPFDATFNFGLAGDIVVVGDWNGDGVDDVGVARPNGTGGLTFFLDSNGNQAFDVTDAIFNFGLAGDVVVAGDWNGNGVDNIGVARSNGSGGLRFFLDSNETWDFDAFDAVFNFGLIGDSIVVGDWNGDGVDNLGVARSDGLGGLAFTLDSNGSWSFESGYDAVLGFGQEQDEIIVGDWNGTGTDALGVVRVDETGSRTVNLDLNGNGELDLNDKRFVSDYRLGGELLLVGIWKQTALPPV